MRPIDFLPSFHRTLECVIPILRQATHRDLCQAALQLLSVAAKLLSSKVRHSWNWPRFWQISSVNDQNF